MHNIDKITREQARQNLMAAVQANNTEAFSDAFIALFINSFIAPPLKQASSFP